jgi:hypothetical protein
MRSLADGPCDQPPIVTADIVYVSGPGGVIALQRD